jgi:hypothetical protein
MVTFRKVLVTLVASVCAVAILASGEAQAITHPYTGTSFGPGGVGSGNFAAVVGVTVDSRNGDVFVLDNASGGHLYKFDSGGEPVDFASSNRNEIEGVGSAEGPEAQVAVDGSTGPDAGDIYVANARGVRIYAESGNYLGELSGGETCGVAVDPSGNVYVGIYPETVRRYVPSSSPVTNSDENGSIIGISEVCDVAADQAGNVYVAAYKGGITKYDALQFGSLSATGTLVDASGKTLTVDQESEEVFVDGGDNIAQYDTRTQPPTSISTFGGSGAGALAGSFGVAVNHATGELYAGDGSRVEIFGAPETVPVVATEPADSRTASHVTLHGTVEPSGAEVTGCVFEYGEGSLDHSVPCEPAPPYTGVRVAASAVVGGLHETTTYRYRIVATTSHSTYAGEELSFTTTGKPGVSGEVVTQAGSTGATLNAEIYPNEAQTTYQVEYGTSTAYGSTTPPISAGSAAAPVYVVAHLDDLQPGAIYHFRFVAISAEGAATGSDLVFTARKLATPGLPDGRGYEMVTPAENEGAETYAPGDAGVEDEGAIYTLKPIAAATDGNAVTYVGSPTSGGNGSQGNGLGNQFLARRNPDGSWTQTNIQPNGYSSPLYWGFSPDLEHAMLSSLEPLVSGAPPRDINDLYVRDNTTGSYRSLLTGTPPNRAPGEFGVWTLTSERVQEGGYAGASADYSHLLFEANDALASGAVDPGSRANNLYESVGGQLRTVNMLPDGVAAPNASFGAPELDRPATVDFSHVISADGSRIFWTDINTGTLYVREDGTQTKLIAEDATYLTASTDGSRVLFTKAGDLYEDDLENGTTRDLAPGGEVLGLAGAAEDLSYVYLVAHGVLAPGGTEGDTNLYLLHGGQTRFIASLLPPNEGNEGISEWYFPVGSQDNPWQADLGNRTAEATPSGRDLVFMSLQSLTGYDNVNRDTGKRVAEVYVYDADKEELSCISCDPSGVAPNGEIAGAKEQGGKPGGLLALSGYPTYQLRTISEDGSRVFFESAQPLVPQAQNGKLNVYEWERAGSGSCADADGCVYLLSSGSSPYPSYLIDASATGNDVFLMTRSALVAADQNEYNDIYDVRVDASEVPVPPQCTGTGCQGVAASPPIFATPASVTYDGVGNFALSSTPAARPKSKKPSCTSSTKNGRHKKSKAKRTKSRQVLCKARKAATRVRRGANGRGGR